ncbi:MAG: flagellar export chaperone FlgN [Nitrospinae bacterium]|nr:flagellar export chaperone FlgN [Nitrospinota bacterium]MBF0633534.1 flagellar export chaperone FlgN [Nitrospinota bacterium]
MDKRTTALLKILDEQKALYESLAQKAGKLVESINGGASMDDLLRIMDEREAIITSLDSGSKKMMDAISGAGNQAITEDEKVTGLKTELESLIKGVMQTDETAVRLLREAFTETQSGLAAMSTGHKTVSAYGKKGKPAFAKYFDRKF